MIASRTTRSADTAAAVISNYGDPSASWSIVLDASLSRPLDRAAAHRRLTNLVATNPHLGSTPAVVQHPAEAMTDVRRRLAEQGFPEGELLKVALATDGRRLLVAGHHGAVDGLGLLAVLGELLGESLGSGARGLGHRSHGSSFYRAGLRRLFDAVVRPPSRFATTKVRGSDAGEWISTRVLEDVDRPRTALLLEAVARAHEDLVVCPRSRRIVLAVGATRRAPGTRPGPDRQGAYVRVQVQSHEGIAETMARAQPEPDFPERPAALGVVPLVVRLLSSRLGATATVSNLGRVSSDLAETSSVEQLTFLPCASGPAGLAVGLVSIGDRSTLSVRARSNAFTDAEAEAIGAAIARRFADHG